MQHTVLQNIIKLFNAFSALNEYKGKVLMRSLVEVYLNQSFSKETTTKNLVFFNQLYFEKTEVETEIERIAKDINIHIDQKQKILIVVYLIDYKIACCTNSHDERKDIIYKLSRLFKINEKEFFNCEAFAQKNYHKITLKQNFKVFDGSRLINNGKRYVKCTIPGQFFIFHIRSADMYLFRYIGDEKLHVNNRIIFKNQVYLFPKGATIRNGENKSLHYNFLVKNFVQTAKMGYVKFQALDIEYTFKNSSNGIKKFCIEAESGDLVAIMGGSGVGKSTLLNLLSGITPPKSGQVLINGVDIKNKNQVEGIIGFVPQDDILIEELTVFENLYFNAKLCIGDKTEDEILDIINQLIIDFDLLNARKLKVGNVLNKFISGGQRKRLNIAMELLRQPSVLFVDEPTSGLSSEDAANVVQLMKEQTNDGKIVIINIHQPFSEIFRLFDKLLVLDKFGHPIYCGHPSDAISFLKNTLNKVDANKTECLSCGNSFPESILGLIEHKKLNPFGEFTTDRSMEPHQWYEKYIEIQPKYTAVEQFVLPKNVFKRPSVFQQFKIFGIRNLLAKIVNLQYILLSLLEAPVLALVLAFFVKQSNARTNEYVFSENENIPAYLFMSAVVALFLGLIISSEEIIKDRKIRKREKFLNLSWWSYVNSKVLYLFSLSAFQMLTYVLVGNYILEIKGMYLYFFLILWSVACFSNILGLYISAKFNSVITIYISIPFLLIPQILLGGSVVRFDKLNKLFSPLEHTPIFSDMLPSRWAYEALVVGQFKHNKFQKIFYEYDKKESNYYYNTTFLFPELLALTNECKTDIDNKNITDTTRTKLKLLTKEIVKLQKNSPLKKIGTIDVEHFQQKQQDVKRFLRKHESILKSNYQDQQKQKSKLMAELSGEINMVQLKTEHTNDAIKSLVFNRFSADNIIRFDDKIVRKTEPIYLEPLSAYGRAHFYSASKRIGNKEFDTVYFNSFVIWMMTILIYLLLVFEFKWSKK